MISYLYNTIFSGLNSLEHVWLVSENDIDINDRNYSNTHINDHQHYRFITVVVFLQLCYAIHINVAESLEPNINVLYYNV